MKKIVVVCDNTMGIPGMEIDDGLAILYLLGQDDVTVEAICTTHGNASTAETFEATQRLMSELGVDIPVVRGADAGSDVPSDAARLIVEASLRSDPGFVLSLGAATDLAAAERLSPGCLARFGAVSLMGGITHTLFVGGRVMNELNFSVDGPAACETIATARAGARILLADAWNCLPVTFWTSEFTERIVGPGYRISDTLERFCIPWMEYARTAWNTDGFVGWDVLAAVALAQPSLVNFESFEVSCNPRLFSVGYLERARDPELAASISLVVPHEPEALCEHIYASWQQAAQRLGA